MPKRRASRARPSTPISRGSSSTGRCRISCCPTLPGPAVRPLPKALAPKPIHQPEFDIPANYFNKNTLSVLAATGRGKMGQWSEQLAAMQKQYGVPASIVVAIWGRETGFGKAELPFDALSAIATQGYMGRRPDVFRQEVVAALKIMEEGHATRGEMRSSWAGAMGYTQFLPSDFEKYAVDFDGDGRRDIWNSVPDALGSTGNSLHSQGWDGKQTWGYEVTLPKGFDCTEQGPDKARPIAEWVKLGVARVKDRPFPEDKLGDPAFLVLPAGLKGPAFLATNNFSVLKLYNNSDVYAIFVGHVADMIAANAPIEFAGEWQPVERLPRERIQRFQEVLVAQGPRCRESGRARRLQDAADHRHRGAEARPAAQLLSEQGGGGCGAQASERRRGPVALGKERRDELPRFCPPRLLRSGACESLKILSH